ncbi:MAG: hypothetical protein Ct9H90mP13_11140 [Pseudomonadota bacterium]|nr:MAG: hypothetical protein Ct9H90mP13_11140 [Pseudomonadota bacterium]
MYDKYILPYLLNYTCGQKPFIKQRQKIVPMAKGKVLEVGIGSGLNMPFLNINKINSLIGIDPSEELIQLAEKRIDDSIPKILIWLFQRLKRCNSMTIHLIRF